MVDPQLAAFKSDLFYSGFSGRASAFHAECRGFESLRPLCGRSVGEQWMWMLSQPSVLRCMDHTRDRLPQKRKLLFSHCWARDLSNRNRARHRDLVRLVEMKHLETRSGLRRPPLESLRPLSIRCQLAGTICPQSGLHATEGELSCDKRFAAT